VYDYADLVQLMSYPFELKIACTTSLQDEIIKAARSGFCPVDEDEASCVFHFVATCFDDFDQQVQW